MKAGYEAQLKSVVMLKNSRQSLPIKERLKVYMPQRHIPASSNWFGMSTPERWEDAFNPEIVSRYYEVVETPGEADFALVGIQSPDGGVGYDATDMEKGGNGYVPITLQYGPYEAEYARETSLAGGSPFEDFTNRSYKNKTNTADNRPDMELVVNTRKEMGDKAVVVVVQVSKPMVFSEIESSADAILVHMGVQDQAVMDLISGTAEPSAMLPFQMPADMKTVEEQLEDVPRDMTPYTDSEGNVYDFAFGLNWSGTISDERVSRYK
jgi:beta-glucosidase